MNAPNKPAPATPPPLRPLAERVATLEAQAQEAKRNRAKNVALFLGILATALALPRAVVDLSALLRQDQIRVTFTDDLDLAAELSNNTADSNNTVTFTFGVLVINDAERVAVLAGIKGSLQEKTPRRETGLPFSLSDIACSSEDHPIQFPFSVGPSDSSRLRCAFTAPWRGRASTILGEEGARQLHVTLTSDRGRDKDHTFCFYLPMDLRTWYAEQTSSLLFENTPCSHLLPEAQARPEEDAP